MTMLERHIRLVTTVQPIVSATSATAVDFVPTNFLMARLAVVAWNANLRCVLNMIINKIFVIPVLVITLRHLTLMDWRGPHIVTPIINIVQPTFHAKCRKQLGHLVTVTISNVTRVSVIRIH